MYSLLLTTACIALGVNHCKTNEWMHAFILIVQCLQPVNFDFNIKCSHFQYFIMNYQPFYKYKIASLNFRFFVFFLKIHGQISVKILMNQYGWRL